MRIPVARVLVLLLLGGCGLPTQYRNYSMPAIVAPAPGPRARAADPVRLTDRNSVLHDGGIRVVLPGRAAASPAFAFRDEEGDLHTPASLKGQVVWVDLWSDWCGTCLAEFPRIQLLHERYADLGLSVLAVCRNSTRAGFEKAARKDWISFAVVDASSQARFPFPYGAFPTSLLLDRAGRVRAYWQGHRSLDAVEEVIRGLLAEPGDPVPGAPVGKDSPPSPVVLRGPRASSSVLEARLVLPRRGTTPGGFFEGTVVLDVDPGWHLTAGGEAGSVPLELRFDPGPGLAAVDYLRPRARRRTLAGLAREVYSGKVEIPLWGLVRDDAAAERFIDLNVAATVQACDAASCLAPAQVLLSGEIWVSD